MNKIYMLDTNICSFIMREQSEVVLKRLEPAVLRDQRIVVSVITYPRCALAPQVRRPPHPASSWLTRSVCRSDLGLRSGRCDHGD